MFSINLLEEAGSSSGSIWIPIVVLGWFLLMTIVGWQVSRRDGTTEKNLPAVDTSHSESNPSELDHH
jgi:hypothetical protein